MDRFSSSAGTLFARDGNSALPGPDIPIDFDEPPFIPGGFAPNGDSIRYYNFDVQPTLPAPIFVLFREGESEPVADQLNIIDVLPGDGGYNDLWQVFRVTVPSDYVANTVTSRAAISDGGFAMESTDTLVNCPVVPEGSTADLRGGSEIAGLHRGWHKDELVHYFSFEEVPLTASSGMVPVADIFVSFNLNPDEAGGGPPSGFKTETGGEQTHNVVAATPGSSGYSPLWSVNIYDNTDFDAVSDLATAQALTLLGPAAAIVNCPVVDQP